MTHIHGPLGFTDFDNEGALVEGYDRASTLATSIIIRIILIITKDWDSRKKPIGLNI